MSNNRLLDVLFVEECQVRMIQLVINHLKYVKANNLLDVDFINYIGDNISSVEHSPLKGQQSIGAIFRLTRPPLPNIDIIGDVIGGLEQLLNVQPRNPISLTYVILNILCYSETLRDYVCSKTPRHVAEAFFYGVSDLLPNFCERLPEAMFGQIIFPKESGINNGKTRVAIHSLLGIQIVLNAWMEYTIADTPIHLLQRI